MFSRFVLPALLATGTICNGEPTRDTTTWEASRRFSGQYIFGFEQSDFTPSGSKERWWLDGNIGPITRRAIQMHPLFLVVEGELSSRGKHGHLGAYVRELRVTRVVSASSAP
jgi:hypothetical protein